MSAIYKYEELFADNEKQNYQRFISSVSTNSVFSDDIWICDKRNVSKGKELYKIKIHFKNTPYQHKEISKYFIILRLIDGVSVRSVKVDLYSLNLFLGFLKNQSLEDVNYHTATKFKLFLDEKGSAASTKSRTWSTLNMFFKKMNGFDNLQLKNPFIKNPYTVDKLIDSKYIPENVMTQLDKTFLNEEIAITYRCIYWVIRLFPSRISEVIGMEIDCLKPFDDHFIITIPTWKQNGGYREPIKRIIHIKNAEIGSYLLKLIKEQQELSLACQPFLEEKHKNALFTYQDGCVQNGVYYPRNRYIVATWAAVDYNLKKICCKYNVTDENGEIYKISTHQLRHNGITDRIRAGFTLPQIAEMTAHHGTAMLYSSYAHLNLFPETIVEPLEYTTEEENPQVLFGGRILNMDAITESRLLKNLRSHRIPGGICTDVTHCKNGMWDCISCKNFVPEKEQLNFFKEQAEEWLKKAKKFNGQSQSYENFLNLSSKYVDIIDVLERV